MLQLKLNLLQSKLQSSRDPVCGPYLAFAFTGKLPLPPLTRQLPGAWKGRGSRADALTCDQGGIFLVTQARYHHLRAGRTRLPDY